MNSKSAKYTAQFRLEIAKSNHLLASRDNMAADSEMVRPRTPSHKLWRPTGRQRAGIGHSALHRIGIWSTGQNNALYTQSPHGLEWGLHEETSNTKENAPLDSTKTNQLMTASECPRHKMVMIGPISFGTVLVCFLHKRHHAYKISTEQFTYFR